MKKYKLNKNIYNCLLIIGITLLILEIIFKFSGILGLIIILISITLIILNIYLLIKTDKKFKENINKIIKTLIFWHID